MELCNRAGMLLMNAPPGGLRVNEEAELVTALIKSEFVRAQHEIYFFIGAGREDPEAINSIYEKFADDLLEDRFLAILRGRLN